jgi:hypothetical protein
MGETRRRGIGSSYSKRSRGLLGDKCFEVNIHILLDLEELTAHKVQGGIRHLSLIASRGGVFSAREQHHYHVAEIVKWCKVVWSRTRSLFRSHSEVHCSQTAGRMVKALSRCRK